MSNFHEEEVLRAGTSGFFKLHSLITYIESLGDMQPAFTDEDYSAPADVVALHVHEYIHYLHNLTTRAGLSSLKDLLFLVKPLLAQKINDKVGLEVDRSIKSHIRMAFNSMRLSNGYVEGIPKGYKWNPVKEWEFTQVIGKQTTLPEIIVDPQQQIFFHVKAIFHDGGKLEFCLMPGFEFITEGIAYEIERDIRRKAGAVEAQLDANTPSYPYLAYAPLIEHLAGIEIPSDERIFIGSLALLAPSPSVALTSLSKLKGAGENTVGAAMLTPIVSDILDTFSAYADDFNQKFIPLLYKVFSSSNTLTKGMEVYEGLIRKGIASRSERSCLELSFIRDSISAKEFYNISAHLLERLVFQGKPGSESEIRWSGEQGRVASMTAEMHVAFATLQSCIHYVQHHLVSDGFETIKPLRSTPCPFRGACSVEEFSEFPDVCKQRPWDARASGKVKQLCVYQSGVDEFDSLIYTFESETEE